MGQAKRIGDGKDGGRQRVTLAGQNVDDDGGREHTLIERLLAGRLDCGKTVDTDTFQDRHHLTVAVMHGLELSAHILYGSWQNPIVERRAVPQRSWLACQDRHVMPWIIDGLATAEVAIMPTDLGAVLPDDNVIGIGVDLGRTANGSRQHGIFVVVETHEAGFAD